MIQKKRKIIRNTTLTICFLLIGGFFVNWYLKNRLEHFIKEMLNEKVSDATDGFYNLTFDDLSIGLFNGELLLKGVRFVPDSMQLEKLSKEKLLPTNYFSVDIGSIHFKGVNLTWRRNYKKLLFKLFEIKDANVQIYNTRLETVEKGDTSVNSLSVYDIISPFINVLGVEKINLENSSVMYFTDDGVNPVCYGLKNIHFTAYGFLLNEDSEISGKLLYSDNFSFESGGDQTLLANTQFQLKTQKIRFDTRDSIIQIQKVQLIPQRELWKKINKIPDSYIDGIIKSVEIKGIDFRRDNAINRLQAKSFDIDSLYVNYVSKRDGKMPMSNKKQDNHGDSLNIDSLNLSWSLYSILSPVLKRVAIDEVGINDAKFKYEQIQGKDTNIYLLDEFKLRAVNFLVDSASSISQNRKFLYSDNFGILARGIEGINIQKNYHFSLKKMVLSTIDKRLRLDTISVKPISIQTKNDYIIANIESIDIDSLYYNIGIDGGLLQINNPQIEYVKAPLMFRHHRNEKDTSQTITQVKGANVWDQASPFFDYLSVKKIELNGGNVTYRDSENRSTYKLSDLDFFAKEVFIDQNTINTSHYFTAANDFSLNFSSFESVVDRGLYRITSGTGEYLRKKGHLYFQNINIIPLTAQNRLNKYYKIRIPLLEFEGIKPLFSSKIKSLEFNAIRVVDPSIDIIADKIADNKNTINNKEISFIPFFDRLYLNFLSFSNARLNIIDKPNRDTTNVIVKSFRLNGTEWNKGQMISLEKLQIIKPTIYIIENHKREEKQNLHKAQIEKESLLPDVLKKGFKLNEFKIVDLKVQMKTPTIRMQSSLPDFTFSNFVWNTDLLSLGQVGITNVKTEIHKKINLVVDTTDIIIKNQSNADIYNRLSKISNQIAIKSINLKNAGLEYYDTTGNLPHKHQNLNETNLYVTGLNVNNIEKTYQLDDIYLNINKFSYPLNDGFYILDIDKIVLDSRKSLLNLDSISLTAVYPKEVFAYKQPRHKDWFDVKVNNVALQGINFNKYIATNQFDIDSVLVNTVILQNYKNKKIPIEHKPMPMLYAGLQNAPVKIATRIIDVKNFDVVYEELPTNGDVASKIFFTKINSHIEGLSNIPKSPDQMYLIRSDGYLMGSGYFTADWHLPVADNYDCFVLEANLGEFDLRELNQLITPTAPLRIDSGLVKNVAFNIEGNSLDASVNMLMLYNNLKLTIQKSSNNNNPNRLFTSIANKVLKSDNPKKPGDKPRKVYAEIVRDPNHSTFNYIWQILEPPLVETVGVSQKNQKFLKGVTGFISKIKRFFSRGNKDKEILPPDLSADKQPIE